MLGKLFEIWLKEEKGILPLANMLVLSRKVGEKILIGDSISITVVRISGGGVRIGIEAPTDMPVVREELATDIENRNPSKAPVLHQENGVKDSVIGTDPNNTFDSETPSQPR